MQGHGNDLNNVLRRNPPWNLVQVLSWRRKEETERYIKMKLSDVTSWNGLSWNERFCRFVWCALRNFTYVLENQVLAPRQYSVRVVASCYCAHIDEIIRGETHTFFYDHRRSTHMIVKGYMKMWVIDHICKMRLIYHAQHIRFARQRNLYDDIFYRPISSV